MDLARYSPILHEATCDVKCLLKSNVARVILPSSCIERNTNLVQITINFKVLTLTVYISKHLTALYFHISIRIFRTLFIFWVFDGVLQSICLRIFCSKHSITF